MRTRLAFLGVVMTVFGAFCSLGCATSTDASGGEAPASTNDGLPIDESLPTGNGGEDDCLVGCGPGLTADDAQGPILIEPQNATITIEDGNIPSQAFTANLGGKDVTGNVIWTFERPEIGDIGKDGAFSPTGKVGGPAKLRAKLGMADGSTTVTVFIKKTIGASSLSPQQKSDLDNPSAGPDPALKIVYPYTKTVFPLGVLAPEIQWNGGAAGDRYRLAIREKHYEYVEYLSAPPPSRHLISEKDWASIGSSGTGAESDPVIVSLTRLSGSKAYSPVESTWSIAQGRLKGSVYYWELPGDCSSASENGRIVRIKPDAAQVDEFFKPGGCWGCHTVSRDGKTMMASFDTEFPFPMLTIDLAKSPAQYGSITTGKNIRGTFSAFNHTGDKILVSNDAMTSPNVALQILDVATAKVLNANAMGDGCGEPAWSPDGKKIAGICNLQGGSWVFDALGGDLAVADVEANGFTTSNVTTLVTKSEGKGRPAYPSFSPNSEWIAFGRPTAGSRSTGDGDLWIVGADGSNLKRLDAASDDNKSFNPVFAPLRAGGYFWLVFISRRDYGNSLVNTGRQQLWITAVDDSPTGAGDPSHPPFYMRGQEGCGKSENAYYALDPCKNIGAGCSSGVDCCNGSCVKDPDSQQYVCGEPPPSGQCVQDGNKCGKSVDCCSVSGGTTCVDGFCSPVIPK